MRILLPCLHYDSKKALVNSKLCVGFELLQLQFCLKLLFDLMDFSKSFVETFAFHSELMQVHGILDDSLLPLLAEQVLG